MSVDSAARRAPPKLSQTSAAGLEVPVRVGADAVDATHIGEPGQAPFTRGIFADGFRGRMWTIRQYSGFVSIR